MKSKTLIVILIYTSVYFICGILRFYPVDFLKTKEVTFKINGLYGFPIPFLSEFHVSTNIGDFQNRDSLLRYKFNSRDIKAYLSQKYKDGKQNECRAVVSGYRTYYPSQVPNILKIECT